MPFVDYAVEGCRIHNEGVQLGSLDYLRIFLAPILKLNAEPLVEPIATLAHV